MTTIAVISDQHFDASSRWEEHLRVMEWIVADLHERKPDLIALGGDLFERRPQPVEMAAATDWIRQLASIAEVVGVYGNHDVPQSLYPLERLDTKYPVRFYATPEAHPTEWGGIVCVPWPSRAQLLASIGDVPREQANQIAADALRAVLVGLGQQLDQCPGKRVFLGHVQLRAATVSTGQPLAPGADFELGLEDLALARCDAYLLGHIHRSSIGEAEICGAPCFYPGSPRRTAFGEVERKGYAIVDLSSSPARVSLIETPCAPMLLLEDEWVTKTASGADRAPGWRRGWAGIDARVHARGAELRLRYVVDADQREAARASASAIRAAMLEEGAVSVQVEPEVRPTLRARAPEVARAVTLRDKLEAHWAALGATPEEPRRGVLLSKLDMLEEEVRRAT